MRNFQMKLLFLLRVKDHLAVIVIGLERRPQRSRDFDGPQIQDLVAFPHGISACALHHDARRRAHHGARQHAISPDAPLHAISPDAPLHAICHGAPLHAICHGAGPNSIVHGQHSCGTPISFSAWKRRSCASAAERRPTAVSSGRLRVASLHLPIVAYRASDVWLQ
jgi:hypothetical protein